jgi:hypothetical protein
MDDKNENAQQNTDQASRTYVAPERITTESNPNTVIIVVLGVIVVVLALMYIWGTRMGTDMPPQPLPAETEVPAEPTLPLDSDAVPALEMELNAADVESLGSELDELEAELDAELNTTP